MLTIRDFINEVKENEESDYINDKIIINPCNEKLDEPLYLSLNIYKYIVNKLFNLGDKEIEYEEKPFLEIADKLDDSLYYDDGRIGIKILDSEDVINAIIDNVNNYNNGDISKEKLRETLIMLEDFLK